MTKLHQQLQQNCIYPGKLDLCHLLLMNDSQYPWCILLPDRDGIEESYQLVEKEQTLLMHESCLMAEGMMSAFNGDKMNIGALGNVVPQLHIHHIVRYGADTAWSGPVWGKLPAQVYDEKTLGLTVKKLQNQFTDKVNWSNDI